MQTTNEKTKTRVLAFGIESADIHLIERWCSEGKLPTIASLMDEGSFRKLISTGDIASASSWPTLHTSASPAKHGISRSHRHLKTGTYEIHKQYSNEVKQEPFWMPLSRAGKRCAIFDVPKSVPQEGFNGVHIINWGEEHQNWKQSSWPTNLIGQVLKQFGKHPLEGWYMRQPKDREGYQEILDKLLLGIETRAKIGSFLLDMEPWDLFMISFSELHWVGHLYWHLQDTSHPRHCPDLHHEFGDAILQCYQAVDRGIATMLQGQEDACAMVISNIGMAPNYSGRHLVGKVLDKLNMSGDVLSKKKTSRRKILPRLSWGALALEEAERIIPIRLITTVKKFVPEKLWDTWTRKALYSGNNWKDSIAFDLPSDYSGAIRINLIGREPNGKVQPGKEYDDTCQKIIDAFDSLLNPLTGKKAVSNIIKVHDEHSGEYLNELPDIIITWASDAPINALQSPEIGLVEGELIDKKHTGGHQPYGFLLIAGEQTAKNQRLADAHIMDVAPTIMHLLGEPIPDSFDGSLLPEYQSQEPTSRRVVA